MLKTRIRNVIGERIRTYRKKLNYSQEELAHKAGLHPTYIGQLERGEKNPTIETIEKITIALDITLEELFRFTIQTEAQQNKTITQLIHQLETISDQDKEVLVQIIKILVEWKESKDKKD